MNEDLIVAEVRKTREKLAHRFDFDIHTIFADLRSQENRLDPMHPLVKDATEWTLENSTVLREKPPG